MSIDVNVDVLLQSVATLKGVGVVAHRKLLGLGIVCLRDLLLHFPIRYEDRTQITALGELCLRIGNPVLIDAEVVTSEIQTRFRRRWIVMLQDKTGVVALQFFHFRKEQAALCFPGMRVRAYGTVRVLKEHLGMIHPQYQLFARNTVPPPYETHPLAVYPTTQGLSQNLWRRWIAEALRRLAACSVEPFHPADERIERWIADSGLIHNQGSVLCFEAAVRAMHQGYEGHKGDIGAVLAVAKQRLVIEELLAYQCAMDDFYLKNRSGLQAPVLGDLHCVHAFRALLTFELTAAQDRAIEEIQADLARTVPMMRLLQGDVGSGKTIVAACALLAAVGSGYQGALMVPTEILARQHYAVFTAWCEILGVKVGLLVSNLKPAEKQEIKYLLSTHEIQIVIGTHALIEEDVVFQHLGCVVMDEQHRFGVAQRLSLVEKTQRRGYAVHQLMMSATPIPRTLAMTIDGHLACSTLDELPKGRLPIQTVLISESRLGEVLDRIRAFCGNGQQVYWICTLIEASDILESQATEEIYPILVQRLAPLRIGLVHGRLDPQTKSKTMQAFYAHDLDVLVATTVIEVGVDVPNATIMVIQNPERLGLAQLHQLRGRVGRGREQSYCVLVYGRGLGEAGRRRLGLLRTLSSGFDLAQADLTLRGSGELLGVRQAGLWQLKIADFMRDHAMMDEIRAFSKTVQLEYPEDARYWVEKWFGRSIACVTA
jgi:ATP-dependent DNA helicase RecG